jgi:hypothetical protein
LPDQKDQGLSKANLSKKYFIFCEPSAFSEAKKNETGA